MRAVVDKLETGVRDIQAQIELFRMLQELPAVKLPDGSPAAVRDLSEHLVGWEGARRMQHAAVVVGLYGCVERFVEEMVEAYVHALQVVIPQFSLLPDGIRKHHTDLSASLLNSSIHGRAHRSSDPARVVARLNSCLNGQDSHYELNGEAFSLHTANFRIDTIDETFGRVGVANLAKRIVSIRAFSDFITREDPNLEARSLRREQIYEPLKTLADKRNDVSHGISSALLSLELLQDTAEFVRLLCAAIGQLLEESLAPHEIQHRGIALGTPIALYNNQVVCFELSGVSLQKFNKLLAQTGDKNRPFRAGRIEEIQVDGSVHEVLSIPEGVSQQVALRVDYHAKQNYEYTLVPTTDS